MSLVNGKQIPPQFAKWELDATPIGKVTDDGKTTPLVVKIGDSILYGKYSGTEVSIDGNDYLIMRESDIFAIYSE